METLDELCQGLLWSLLNLGEVDAHLSLLATSDEQANKPIS